MFTFLTTAAIHIHFNLAFPLPSDLREKFKIFKKNFENAKKIK